MSPSSSLSSAQVIRADVLLVRDAEGCYRPALAEEVLQVARRVLARRVRRGATMSSPQAVKDHLRLHLGVLDHEVWRLLPRFFAMSACLSPRARRFCTNSASSSGFRPSRCSFSITWS